MVEFENSSPVTVSTASGEATASSFGNQIQDTQLIGGGPPKKKRNLPGMPDPDAEVIALSPKTLLATNRFVCEICNKGFQRDQNLQLHRRGHNLPWKLRQRTSKEFESGSTCAPNRVASTTTRLEPSVILPVSRNTFAGNTGKRNGMRAVRDSFITHRAFCDALAEESARAQTLAVVTTEGNVNANGNGGTMVGGAAAAAAATSPPPQPLTPSTTSVASPGLSIQSSEIPENPMTLSPATPAAASTSTSNANVFVSIFAAHSQPSKISAPSSFLQATTPFERTSLSLSSPLYLSNNGSSIFTGPANDHCNYAPTPQPAMSATALLQKAAQMGAAASNPSLLRGLGLIVSTAPSAGQDANIKSESNVTTAGLALGVVSNGSSGLTNPMMGSSSLFGNKPTTLDLLGLGMGDGGASSSGLSALLTSFGGGFNVGAASATSFGVGGSSDSPRETWDGAPERKPNGSAML
ncbi:hypothetical protein F3Y22_tig00116999pilonHSYRG00017 [Hibiscus syriacus]|uniref:C2H2-type domain-containing protein n=1 Tax=Hibiscus syriacus TaxID=106335 RepID=A0A6A2WKU9_HIBSY|nr:hypothetical protein F3Y22_tig00116999pilonHSYRG00017 [Hibiscus syriacus]